jgi:hemin uptake protein HemP
MSNDLRPTPGRAPAVAAIPALPASPPSQQVLESSELLRGARLVEIRHNGEIYRLQATRLGKLILTK